MNGDGEFFDLPQVTIRDATPDEKRIVDQVMSAFHSKDYLRHRELTRWLERACFVDALKVGRVYT